LNSAIANSRWAQREKSNIFQKGFNLPILVITTGGTIGALPYEDPRHPPEISSMPKNEDLVRKELQSRFVSVNTRCISLEPRDSKLIDLPYRENLLSVLTAAEETSILITHGTDTILATAATSHSH
jgi:L-asparaginase/Glu-tRNA(Gln) amidotransferase subunit D